MGCSRGPTHPAADMAAQVLGIYYFQWQGYMSITLVMAWSSITGDDVPPHIKLGRHITQKKYLTKNCNLARLTYNRDVRQWHLAQS